MTTQAIQPYKIEACKFDYEFLGKTVEELARIYGFEVPNIEAEIKLSGWERRLEPTALPDTTDITQFAKALEEITRSKLSVISLFRQIENQPLIAQIEKVFLEKALELAAGLNIMDDRSATKLANLVKAVSQLQERNPVDLAEQFKEMAKSNGPRVVVNIANQLH